MHFCGKIVPLLVLMLWSNFIAFAQDSALYIRLNKTFFQPGDTIYISASQPQKNINATLFLMAEHEDGFVWQMRWPMLKGVCEPALIIPDSMPQGQYRLFFSLLQNLFTVSGKVKSPENVDELSVTLLTSGGDLYENDIPVNSNGQFVYKNVLFENNATLLFTQADKRNNDNLDIEISTVLDSVSYPRRSKVTDIYIGQTKPAEGIKKFNSINSDPERKAQVLETVIVHTKPMNRGELFNKKYSSGLFRDMNERILNFLDDQSLANSVSVFQTLMSRVAGLTVRYGVNPVAFWRGQPVTFYLDETRSNAMIIDALPVSDIAIIKAYPPPFFGNPGANGGAIAVYTKRGGLSDDNYKNAFRVKGYTPIISKLPTMPDMF
jgi:hypothetical protein